MHPALLTATLLLTVAGGARAQEAAARPDPGGLSVVLIVADDLGVGDLSCYGGSIPTPHIDSLARTGTRFTQAYVTAPTCGPSRAGFLTGRHQLSFGFEFNTSKPNIAAHRERGLPPDVPTLPERLGALGLATGMVGKWHLGLSPESHPEARGFERFFGFLDGSHAYLPGTRGLQTGPLLRGREPIEEPEYLTDAFAREAARFVRDHAEERFFLYAAFSAPHRPHQATEEYLERFPDLTGTERVYAAMVSALDDGVGRILATLEETGRAQDTLVLFLSDNGAVAGDGEGSNGDLRLGKFYLFEGGVRVPLIVRDPRSAVRGGVAETVVSSLDLFPTILAAAGGDPDGETGLEGHDLAATLAGERAAIAHERLYWRAGASAALRRGDLKLIRSGLEAWMYDLSADVGELRDLSEERAEELETLHRELSAWTAKAASPLWPAKRLKRELSIDGKRYSADY